MPSPNSNLFVEILKRECEQNNVVYDDAAAKYFMSVYVGNGHREMRGCHPRDIVEAIADAARYQGAERALTPATIDDACSHYFV